VISLTSARVTIVSGVSPGAEGSIALASRLPFEPFCDSVVCATRQKTTKIQSRSADGHTRRGFPLDATEHLVHAEALHSLGRTLFGVVVLSALPIYDSNRTEMA
jgi:hypothetical protein